jgi:hypothetical protein
MVHKNGLDKEMTVQYINTHCKKRLAISSPQHGCHSNSPWAGIIHIIIPAQGEFGKCQSVIPGAGKTTNLFFTVYTLCSLW